MKKLFIYICLILMFFGNCFAQVELDVTNKKIDELVTEDKNLNSKDIAFYSDKKMIKKITDKLDSIFSKKNINIYEKKKNEFVLDCLINDNFRIINIIELDKKRVFINYICPKEYQKQQSFVFLIYNKKSKSIENINFALSNYTPMVFHEYSYDNKKILYTIGNNSSLGMATTDVYLIAVSSENLSIIFSECISFSQSFFDKNLEDISINKDFIFDEDKIRVYGKDYDFNQNKYIDYDKTYKLP